MEDYEASVFARFEQLTLNFPTEGLRFFIEEEEWWKNSRIASDAITRLAYMWDGYKRAGDVLVKYCLSANNRPEKHELIYPILFCYRHFVELTLKWLIIQYGACVNSTKSDLNTHSLVKLWSMYRGILDVVAPERDPDDVKMTDSVEKLVWEFQNADPYSFAFRYATDKDGKIVLLSTRGISLENLRDVAEGLHNYFNGADGCLSNLT